MQCDVQIILLKNGVNTQVINSYFLSLLVYEQSLIKWIKQIL